VAKGIAGIIGVIGWAGLADLWGSPCHRRQHYPHSRMAISPTSTIFMEPTSTTIITITTSTVNFVIVGFVIATVIRCSQPSFVFRTL
jgi:hypothetical protein